MPFCAEYWCGILAQCRGLFVSTEGIREIYDAACIDTTYPNVVIKFNATYPDPNGLKEVINWYVSAVLRRRLGSSIVRVVVMNTRDCEVVTMEGPSRINREGSRRLGRHLRVNVVNEK